MSTIFNRDLISSMTEDMNELKVESQKVESKYKLRRIYF